MPKIIFQSRGIDPTVFEQKSKNPRQIFFCCAGRQLPTVRSQPDQTLKCEPIPPNPVILSHLRSGVPI